MNVIIQTVSGVRCLVRATSVDAARQAWQREVEEGRAEDLIRAERAARAEAREIAAHREHDYR